MMSKYILFTFLFIGLLACNNTNRSKTSKKTFTDNEPTITLQKLLPLTTQASKSFSEWKEYQNFKQFFNQYLKTTPSEALSNAKELNTLAEQLKDSIRINTLKIKAFKARLNVLQNETMRLQDMVTISNLKSDDVKNQLIKIMAAFNATNAKLNNIILQLQVEEDIKIILDSL